MDQGIKINIKILRLKKPNMCFRLFLQENLLLYPFYCHMLNFRLNNCFVHLKFMHVLHIYIHLTLFSTLIFSIGKGLQLLPEVEFWLEAHVLKQK